MAENDDVSSRYSRFRLRETLGVDDACLTQVLLHTGNTWTSKGARLQGRERTGIDQVVAECLPGER